MLDGVLFDLQIELFFFGLGPSLEDADVGSLLVADLKLLSQLIVDLKVGGWDDLEDGVAVVLEVEQVLVGFILGCGVCETFGCQEADVAAFGFRLEAPQQYALPVAQVVVLLIFRHGYVYLNINYNRTRTQPHLFLWKATGH